MICWCFLIVGILLGSWWVYYELGWGGWWFWDFVENVFFMFWLLVIVCIYLVILFKLNYWILFFNMFIFLCCVLGIFFVCFGLLVFVYSFVIDFI